MQLPPPLLSPLHPQQLMGRVLRVNLAKPIKAKLGASKPVWSTEEWLQNSLKEDQALADAQEDADDLTPMEDPAVLAAKQKGLMV